jgi:hypothetical protein
MSSLHAASLFRSHFSLLTFLSVPLFSPLGVLCLWIDIDPFEPNGTPPDFQPIALFFNIWHEHRYSASSTSHTLDYAQHHMLLQEWLFPFFIHESLCVLSRLPILMNTPECDRTSIPSAPSFKLNL